jgi:cobalt/nickel transport system permease protein
MDHLRIDDYANLSSLLHRWDPRLKLIGLFILIFSIAFIQNIELMPIVLLISIGYYLISKIPFSFLMTRLRYPGVFLLMVAIIFPFFSGVTVLYQVGFVKVYSEGLIAFLLIASKFVAIMIFAVLLFGTSAVLSTIRALQQLRFPPILVDMLLMTYRYLFEISHDFRKMQLAMRMKNFHATHLNFQTLNQLAALAGTMLIRSYERSEKIYKAMILRGYASQEIKQFNTTARFTSADWIKFTVTCLLSIGLVVAEFYFRGIL